MESRKIVKEIIELQKSTLDNTYNSLVQFQENTEKMTKILMEQQLAVPEEGKKALDEWMQAIKQGCNNYKKNMDENFENVRSFFTTFEGK